MKRLILAIVAGVAACIPAGPAAWIVGAILLATAIPGHVALWNVFPVWHHLTFLASLVPLTLVGSLLPRWRVPGRSGSADTGRAAP